MSGADWSATAAAVDSDTARARDWFFLAMAGTLLLLVLIGFSPTYFLRSHLGTTQPPLPPHLHVHGAILTLWFAIAFSQPLLVASGNIAIHRRVGVAGVATAVALVLASANVLVRAVARSPQNGLPTEALPLVIFGDACLLIVFSVLVGSGVLLRRNRETHKRLMLLASIAVISPAVGRLPVVIENPVLLAVGGQFALLAVVIAHDLMQMRRVHRATLFGTLLIIAGTVAGVAFGSNALGRALVEQLR